MLTICRICAGGGYFEKETEYLNKKATKKNVEANEHATQSKMSR